MQSSESPAADSAPGGGCYEILDPRFKGLIDPVAFLETLHGGNRWTEGPVYFADLRCLIWSDIPNERMLRWDEESGQVSIFRRRTGNANGNTRDRQGRLITCEQGARRVVRTEWDGSLTVLAEAYEGRRLNSPNDVVVKSDGSIWFTDPNYGIISDYVGSKAPQELAGCYVFRIDPDGSLSIVADDFSMPNGLAFSPDETTLYIADSGFLTDEAAPHHLRAFEVGPDNGLSKSRVFADIEPGIPDGFRVDVEGNLWISAWDGVQCHTPEGELIGKIRVPEVVANLTFGGPKGNRLFITATTSVYALFLNVCGVQWP